MGANRLSQAQFIESVHGVCPQRNARTDFAEGSSALVYLGIDPDFIETDGGSETPDPSADNEGLHEPMVSSGIGKRFVKSGALLFRLFRFCPARLFHFIGFQDFAAIEALEVLRFIVFGDELRAFVLAGRIRHGDDPVEYGWKYSIHL